MSLYPGMFKDLPDNDLVAYAQSGKPGSVMAIDELSNRKMMRGAMQSPVSPMTVMAQGTQGYADGGVVGDQSWMELLKAYLKGKQEGSHQSALVAGGGGIGSVLNNDAYIPTLGPGQSVSLSDLIHPGTPPTETQDLPFGIGGGPEMDAYRKAPNYDMRAPYHPDVPLPPGPNITQFDLMMQQGRQPPMMPPWAGPTGTPPVVSPASDTSPAQAAVVQALQSQAPDYSGRSADFMAQAKAMQDQAKWLALLQAGGTIMSSSLPAGGAVGQGISSGLGVYAQQMNDYQRALKDVMDADYQNAVLQQRSEESNLDRQQGAINLNAQLAASSGNLDKQIAAEDRRTAETNAARIETAKIRAAAKSAGLRESTLSEIDKQAEKEMEGLLETTEGLEKYSPEYYKMLNQIKANKIQWYLQYSNGAAAEPSGTSSIIEDLADQ